MRSGGPHGYVDTGCHRAQVYFNLIESLLCFTRAGKSRAPRPEMTAYDGDHVLVNMRAMFLLSGEALIQSKVHDVTHLKRDVRLMGPDPSNGSTGG